MFEPHHRVRRRMLPSLLACALLAGCGGDDESGGPERVTIGVDRASGKRAKAITDGVVRDPVAVAIRTSAAPKQRVVVDWGLSCPKTDEGKTKGTGGSYVTTPPNVRALELPKRRIAFCAVSAQARLARSGRVRVTVVASTR